MKFNISQYRRLKPKIIKYYNEKNLSKTSEMCVMSSIALLAMYTFLEEDFGGYADKIEELRKFYAYDSVVG